MGPWGRSIRFSIAAAWVLLIFVANAESEQTARGCWTRKWQTAAGRYDWVTRCFMQGGRMTGWLSEDGRNGFIVGKWSQNVDHADWLVIDDELCLGEAINPGTTMRLSDCSHAGNWIRDPDKDPWAEKFPPQSN